MKRRILIGALILVLLVAGFFAWKFLGPTVHSPQKKYFYISTGSGYDQVKKSLLDSGIIRGTRWFDWAAGAIGYDQVKPGRYEIRKGMSIVSLVRMLKNGQQ